ncbi:hypothetical protein MBLNU13_g05538t1 [Cladosporium sp. NU13]
MADPYIFSEITSTDRAGVVWVASILSLLYSLSTLVARFFVKYHTLGYDDWLILAATIVALAQYIAVFVSLKQGLGISSLIQSEDAIRDLGPGVLANGILFILAIALTKLSVVFFVKRLLTQELRKAWWFAHIVMGLTVAWTIASVLLVSVGCSPQNAVFEPQTCTGMTARWSVVIGTDALLELSYVALSVALVVPLQMSNYIKVTVVAAFAFRLPCVVLSSLHGVAIHRFVTANDHGLSIANRLLWQQVVLGYALVSATVPTLKSFIRGYNKALGRDVSTRSRKLGGGYGLESYGRSGEDSGLELRSVPKSARRGPGEFGDKMKLRQDGGDQYRANAFGDGDRVIDQHKRRTSSGSHGSEDPIIRRDINVTVEYEDAHKN